MVQRKNIEPLRTALTGLMGPYPSVGLTESEKIPGVQEPARLSYPTTMWHCGCGGAAFYILEGGFCCTSCETIQEF